MSSKLFASFGDPSGILCAAWFFDRSERLRKIFAARDFTVPKDCRVFRAASTNPNGVLILLKIIKKRNDRKAISFFGDPSGIRTPDTLIKSQVLYRLS